MSAPKWIQRKRTKGWRMPEGAVYVGRPTKWGNPYRWTDYQAVTVPLWSDGEPHYTSPATRRGWAVTDFEAAVDYDDKPLRGYPSHEEIRRELAGKDLVCWCPEGQPCHADVLIKIANRTEGERARRAEQMAEIRRKVSAA
jgi:hypothetical protein